MKDFNLEIHKCALCYDAPCNKDCDICPERIIRAIRFDNLKGACYLLDDKFDVNKMSASRSGCPKNVDVKGLMTNIMKQKKKLSLPSDLNVDLSTDICGVKLENPFLLSSSVVSSTYDMCARAFEAGWAGAAFKTICLMDIHEASPRFSALKDWDNSFMGFKNIEQLSDYSFDENLEVIRKLKEKYPNKVIVASIMGRNKKEWKYLAQKVDEAGADVIELNFSCPNMELKGTGSDVGQSPDAVYKYTRAARKGTKKPILAKMTPNVTDMREVAIYSILGGANGIAAINTIKSITNVDISSLVPEPVVNDKSSVGGYSGRAVKPIALRFIAELANCKELKKAHISGMGGIYTWRDALEFLLLGAGSLQVTTAVMEYGYRIIDDLILGLKIYMKENNALKVSDLIGKSSRCVVDTDNLERDTILFPKFDKEKCIGCGRCHISCMDGGHQAISFDKEKRVPVLDGSKCVGCHLCKLVCPMKAIDTVEKRISKK